MLGHDTIVYDTETTGLPIPIVSPLNKHPKIWEFAGIRVDSDLNEIDRLEFLCNPGCKLPSEVIELTGMTDDKLKDEKPFAAYYTDLSQFFLGTGRMVAHNLAFDRDMLEYDLRRIGKLLQFPWPMDHVCTANSTTGITGYRLKLGKLYEYATGETFQGAHRAMVDTEALLVCYRWAVEQGYINKD